MRISSQDHLSRPLLIALLTSMTLIGAGSLGATASQSQDEPLTATQRYQAITEVVMLDLVVQDRSGRPVRNLKSDEIEVYENGVKQKISGFRLVGEQTIVTDVPEGQAQSAPAPPEAYQSSDDFTLVTLVFDSLDVEGRALARKAAHDFLKSKNQTGIMGAVLAIDRRLYVVQDFTTDIPTLSAAVESATTRAYYEFASQSDAIRNAISLSAQAGAAGEAETAGAGRNSQPGAGIGASFADAQLARMTANMLQQSEAMARDQHGNASIYGLLSIVRAQRQLRGRKTVLYFSQGIHVPPKFVDSFRSTISEANRANVTVYAIDARGLQTTTRSRAGRELLEATAAASQRSLMSDGGRSISRQEVMIGESAEESLRLDTQGTLADISESTGGFLISNTNDARKMMDEVTQDIQTYYEVSYAPAEVVYDGSFRSIEVKVSRPGVKVRTRNGYFALPPSDGPVLLPYEVPMLAALSSNPFPRDLPFLAKALRFRQEEETVKHALVMEVPISNFTIEENEKDQTYTTRFSLMGLIKTVEGDILHKFSQDYPLEGDLARVPALKAGTVVFLREFDLPPGRYRLETAILDHQTQKTSAKKSWLIVTQPTRGIRLSSLSAIRRTDELREDEGETSLAFQNMKVVPNIGETELHGTDARLPLFIKLYPNPKVPAPATLMFDLVQNGQMLARVDQQLPEANEHGEIAYTATLPVGHLPAGRYEIRAVAQQAESVAVEHLFFSVSGTTPPVAAEDVQ